jgi:hypothetical protein
MKIEDLWMLLAQRRRLRRLTVRNSFTMYFKIDPPQANLKSLIFNLQSKMFNHLRLEKLAYLKILPLHAKHHC